MTTETTLSSHMPVLMEIIETTCPQSILEFGSGFYSSRLFLERIPEVFSFEFRPEWAEKLEPLRAKHPNWNYTISSDGVASANVLNRTFDLIFVDNGDRIAELLFALDHAPTVVMHDSQKGNYQLSTWPQQFKRFMFTKFPVTYATLEHGDLDQRPWTTVWTTNSGLAKKLAYWVANESELYTRHSYPYFPEPVVKA